MELDERKKVILKAIIQNYLETGEPVGSRTISKYTDLNLSSATIRNEMSDLEEMGYILQPHTSAGRIPSDMGYRLYVNELIEQKNQEVDEVRELMIEKTDRLEKVLKQVVQVLAKNTNYATMIAGPAYHQNSIKFIQLSHVGADQLLATVVAEGNLVKNQMIHVAEPIDEDSLLELNLMLNTQLNGLTIGEINLDMITRMKQQAGMHSEVISGVVDAVAEVGGELAAQGLEDELRVDGAVEVAETAVLEGLEVEHDLSQAVVAEAVGDTLGAVLELLLGELLGAAAHLAEVKELGDEPQHGPVAAVDGVELTQRGGGTKGALEHRPREVALTGGREGGEQLPERPVEMLNLLGPARTYGIGR